MASMLLCILFLWMYRQNFLSTHDYAHDTKCPPTISVALLQWAYIYILFYIRWQFCGGFVKDVILKPFKRKLKCCIIEYINIYCNALCSVIEMFTNEHLDNWAKVRITLRNTETYSSSVCTHLSSSMTWLPINQTKLLKYGTAVLSRI